MAEPSSKKLDVKLIDTLLNERILDAFILQLDIEFDGVVSLSEMLDRINAHRLIKFRSRYLT